VKNLKFSGHDSFHCRPFWLKKGYDFVKSKKAFNDEAVFELGVGRNMVNSIRYWLLAFDIIDKDNKETMLASKLFEEGGWDLYLEDEATLWLLHYSLCKKNYASIYNLIFTELRKTKPEFSKNHLLNKVREIDASKNQNTVSKDFSVFLRSYYSKIDKKNKEESTSALLNDLNLITLVDKENALYNITNKKEQDIAWQVVLYCILNEDYGSSISFKNLMSDKNGIGNIFAFSQDGLESKLIEIDTNRKDIIYKNDAGIKELQFKKKKPNKFDVLKNYYEN